MSWAQDSSEKCPTTPERCIRSSPTLSCRTAARVIPHHAACEQRIVSLICRLIGSYLTLALRSGPGAYSAQDRLASWIPLNRRGILIVEFALWRQRFS